MVSKAAGSAAAGGRSLRDSVLEFREPLEPVAGEDGDALKRFCWTPTSGSGGLLNRIDCKRRAATSSNAAPAASSA